MQTNQWKSKLVNVITSLSRKLANMLFCLGWLVVVGL